MGPRRGTRPPAWPSGRPAASPAVRPPRQPIRPVQGGVGFGRRPLFCSRPSVPPPSAPRRPRLRRPRRPGPNAPPCHLRAPRPRSLSCHPPRSAPEESLRRLPSPSPVVGPCRLPSQRTFLKREFSEIAFSETSFAKGAGYFLFRNVLYGGAGLFPFQKRPLRKGRAVSFSETSFAGVPDPPPLRSALRHARRHLGPSLPHLSRGHFPLRPLGLPSLEVDEVPCLPDSPCAPSASASVFVHAVSSASSCSSI